MSSEDMIRQLLGSQTGMISAPMDRIGEAMRLYDMTRKQSAECAMLNLRGECANPNLIGENGLMSWKEYDAIRAAGKDPKKVSYDNLNRPQPWEDAAARGVRSMFNRTRGN